MKKTLLMAALAASIMIFFGCKTTGSSRPAESNSVTDGGSGSSNERAAPEQEMRDVYNEYRGSLILDGAETYTVVRNDTLSKISRAKYNNGFYYPIILLASFEAVKDLDQIEPGMKLTIPNLDRNLQDDTAKGKIREFLIEVAGIEDDRNRHDTADGLRALAKSL